ncbi:tektin-4-like [Diorhabda sublineata]|uniref:tektin-4-like n=1 Tax=Diorhabda sublineata TaxID=1163346 RepID=UPI0024E09BEA|nr:tektin-4-like [Diorhabda sublineata]
MDEKFATVGRTHPEVKNPATEVPVPNELRPITSEPFDYLPQKRDSRPPPLELHMGPVGPWATGRVNWGPLSGLTGIRPVVDKYSIHRYSESEWKYHNKELLEMVNKEQKRANLIDWNGRQCLEHSLTLIDKNQQENTKKLYHKELELHKRKTELEKAISDITEEIYYLEEEKRRIQQASKVLIIPESIANECIERRNDRMDVELIRDEVEEELTKEYSLCSQIRESFSSILKNVQRQLIDNRNAKQQLEFDWSDKKISHEIDTVNMSLNNRSNTPLFKPGSVYYPRNQTTPEYWEQFTEETVSKSESIRKKSIELRSIVDYILTNASRDLRTQADKVENALTDRIETTRNVIRRLENELKVTLRQIVDAEILKEKLKSGLRRLDTPIKLVQTRLDNRLSRPRVDNCRDEVHRGLMDEAKYTGESEAALRAELKQAEHSELRLIQIRGSLEREIIVKKKSLDIDVERIRNLRLYIPSATALSGR